MAPQPKEADKKLTADRKKVRELFKKRVVKASHDYVKNRVRLWAQHQAKEFPVDPTLTFMWPATNETDGLLDHHTPQSSLDEEELLELEQDYCDKKFNRCCKHHMATILKECEQEWEEVKAVLAKFNAKVQSVEYLQNN